MTKAIMALNAGSSSLKAALFSLDDDQALANCLVDRIGTNGTFTIKLSDGTRYQIENLSLESHVMAMKAVINQLKEIWKDLDLIAIGHRVVHGGDFYSRSVIVSNDVIKNLESLSPFAPLHQPHNLEGIEIAIQLFPNITQVACFDTAFHRNHPWVNDTFALPRAFYDEGIRRYGFHGLSYQYIANELRTQSPYLCEGKVVVAHLGNGASMCAMQNGRSVASTMGFSALDGLPMGTRCGQLDPGVLLYLLDQRGMTAAEITDLLYKKSGLLGLSEISNDMRTLEQSEADSAKEAIDYFIFRCQREVGAMAAALGGIDALVFCGGIGENSRIVRSRICERLGWMGIEIDYTKNQKNSQIISTDLARTTVMVLPTNEEQVILRDTRSLIALRGAIA